jgi:uncharacterized protein YeaO (DUF488 family)
MIALKRIYEKASKDDGYRILVDRLWPRGVSKAKAKLDLWFKDTAPSNELRTWYGHDPKRWSEFKRKYNAELTKNRSALSELKNVIKKEKRVTLLFGAKDIEHNEAVVLAARLRR